MNVDPSANMVVFDIKGHGEPLVTSGATQDDYCVQRAWLSLPVNHSRAARKVARIYSEWQPSAADIDFIKRTFPKAALTYSFERPGPAGWDAAFDAARQVIERVEAHPLAPPPAGRIALYRLPFSAPKAFG